MRYKKYVLLCLAFAFPVALWSQTTDFGIWSNIGLEKKLGKWDFSGEAELRTQDNANQVDKWSFQLESSYSIFKQLKVGAAYQFIYFHDTRYWDFQPRHRNNVFLQAKQKLGNFTFTLRERVQVTYKDESDRIKKSGKINTYKINPEWAWRNRIKVSYDIPQFPVTPSFLFESFYQLNNPDGNVFDKLRYTLSFNYHLSKHHDIEVYGLIDKDINVDDPVKMYLLGVGYAYSF
jgi:hypothetical protein